MPMVNHVNPWMCYIKNDAPKKTNEIADIFTNNAPTKSKTNNLNRTNDLEAVNNEIEAKNKNNLYKTNDCEVVNNDVNDSTHECFKNKTDKQNKYNETIAYNIHGFVDRNTEKDVIKIFEHEDTNIDSLKERIDVLSNIVQNKRKIIDGNNKIEKENIDKACTRISKKRKGNRTKQQKWRMNLKILVTLAFLNVSGKGNAVEVISTNSLASLLGYPSTCTLGAEVRSCTLSITCWLRGGTRLRGCGGWLFSCCQQPDNTWDSFDNNVPSSEWTYKVSPPRLRQVPHRNVIPNNIFRRRVDDDVTQVECGVPSSRILQKRIIGGREARLAEFPWQAHVRISEFQCGGVLVSQWYVATAAHCVSRAHIRDIVVWLGALDTSAGSHTARKVGVHKKILHPLFQFRMTQPDRYDIALLRLSRPIAFSRHIRAICLPDTAMALRGRSAVIAGWGKTDATDTHTGTNMLRSATVPILSKEQCLMWHQSKQISVEIHSEMICAGHSDGHQDACLGDSGGPLIVPENGRYYLVGITSAGFGCGVDHQPGIYHNVQVTTSWIRGVIGYEDSRRYEDNAF